MNSCTAFLPDDIKTSSHKKKVPIENEYIPKELLVMAVKLKALKIIDLE
jgi:hypothetical protein